MSTAAVESQCSWDALLQAWRGLDVPDGWRAEIIEESLTVSPPPSEVHNVVGHFVHRALARSLPDDLGIFQTLGVRVVPLGELYIPDLAVVPLDLLPSPEPPLSAEHAVLVVEITSRGNAERDRKTKLWGYAHAPVPHYLLIDPWDRQGPAVTLHSDPRRGAYQRVERVPYGAKILLPSPVDMVLDTAQFPPT